MSNPAENLSPAPVGIVRTASSAPSHYQIHLKGKGHSGRGVRYRVLKPSELDRNEIAAAKTLEDGFTKEEYAVEVARLGLAQMIVSYTDQNVKEPQSARWLPADAGYLDRQWDLVFTTRDTGVLRHIFQTEHGVNKAELEAILAGKVEVLAD